MLRLPAYLTEIEIAIVSAIISKADEYGPILETQFESSSLQERDFNGYGFYTRFVVLDAIQLPWTWHHFDINALVDGQLYGFMLWVADGRVDCIEGYPLGDHVFPPGKERGVVEIS